MYDKRFSAPVCVFLKRVNQICLEKQKFDQIITVRFFRNLET